MSVPVFIRGALYGCWKNIDRKEVWWDGVVCYDGLSVAGVVMFFDV